MRSVAAGSSQPFPVPSAWPQAQGLRMVDEPPITASEWAEILKLSPAVLRMVLQAHKSSGAPPPAIGARPGLEAGMSRSGSDIVFSHVAMPAGDADVESEPGDMEGTLLAPKQPAASLAVLGLSGAASSTSGEPPTAAGLDTPEGDADSENEPGDGEGTQLVPTPPDFPPPETARAATGLSEAVSSTGRAEASDSSARPRPMLQSFPKCKRPKLSTQPLRSPERGPRGRP